MYDNSKGGTAFIIPKKTRPPAPGAFPQRSTSSEDTKSNGKTEDRIQRAAATKDARLNVWTGSLRFGDQTVESIDLYSPFREGVKPSGFSTSLEVQRLVHWRDCLKWPPIMELAKPSANGSLLLQRQFLLLCPSSFPSSSASSKQLQPAMRASYLYLINTFSPLFLRICNELQTKKQAALGVLANGSLLLLFPESTLSTQLGCPVHEEASILHCLFISSTPIDSSIYFFDINMPRNPSISEKLDGADSKFIAILDQYRRQSGLPLVRKTAPKPIESLLSPREVPPAGKPPTPYIPTPGYPMHRYSGDTPIGGKQQQHQQKYHQQQQFSMQTPKQGNGSAGMYSMLLAPPPPPPEEITAKTIPNTESSGERRQKNKDMIANAFAQMRNIGKEPAIGTPTSGTPKTTINSNVQQQQQETAKVTSQPTVLPPSTLFASRDIPVNMDPRIKDPRLSRHILASSTPGSTIEKDGIPPLMTTATGQSKAEQKNSNKDLTSSVASNERTQTEVVYEATPMDIDDDTSEMDEQGENSSVSSGQQPYSPSHPLMSSPEPMDGIEEQVEENVEKLLNNSRIIIKKKPAQVDAGDVLPKIKQTDNGMTTVEQNPPRTETRDEAKEFVGNRPVKMEPRAQAGDKQHDSFILDTTSDLDLTIATTTTSDSTEFTGKTNGGAGVTEGNYDANTSSTNLSGFAFDYLGWNAAPGGTKSQPLESLSTGDNVDRKPVLEFLNKINAMAKGAAEKATTPNVETQQRVEVEGEEDDNDKDFRQLWSPANNGEEEGAANGKNCNFSSTTNDIGIQGVQQRQLKHPGGKRPHDPRNLPLIKHQKTPKILPSLLELNVTPPSSTQNSPSPTTFFTNENENTDGQSTSSFQSITGSPTQPLFSTGPSSSGASFINNLTTTKVPPLAKFRAVSLEMSPAAARYQRYKPQSQQPRGTNDPRLQSQQHSTSTNK